MDNIMPTRLLYFFGFVAITCLLLVSIYLQVFENVIPCPLCTLQRLSFALLGILFFIGVFFHAKRLSRFCINFLSAVTAIFGIFLAGRQIWLQHYATSSGECGVSVQYMMKILPLNEVMRKIFEGSAECTQRGWEFFYLNMAEWALVWFILFLFLIIYLFIKDFKLKR